MFIMNILGGIHFTFPSYILPSICSAVVTFQKICYIFTTLLVKTPHSAQVFIDQKHSKRPFMALFVKILENFTQLARNLL